jgi:hypothetical protein
MDWRHHVCGVLERPGRCLNLNGGEMASALSTCLPALVLAIHAAGCKPSPSFEAVPPGDERIAAGGASIAVGDTAFIEERRYEQVAPRGPDGRCQWRLRGSMSLPVGVPVDTIRRVRSERTVSMDPETCVVVWAAGYRRALPPEVYDTFNTGGISAGASFPPGSPPPPPPRR